MTSPLRMVQRNALVFRAVWRSALLFNFLHPTLFLLAMGFGLGPLVDRGDATLPGGVDYLRFIAPGLLAAACMQTASFESSFPIAGKMNFHRSYEAIAATPMRVVDMVVGELTWIATRVSVVAAAFMLVLFMFDIPDSVFALLAVPAAVLTGMAFSAVIFAYAVSLRDGKPFNFMFRFVITPLFLFSGVFFPVARLPEGFQTFAKVTPLYHGVELVRGLTLGTLESPNWIMHSLYLLVMLGLGLMTALVTFRRRIEA